ncbi:hypothetical protein EJ110_NYTH07970 [Nymphaea thermarum]|nr:hypothetical protein EJ110_NYTH07970 [Nymphaea thermarum]
MWVEVVCGLVIYKLFRLWVVGEDDELDDKYESNVHFVVAEKIEKIYGGKVYVGLRIPDDDNGERRNVDMVLVSKGKEVMVMTVKNLHGFVEVGDDRSWICRGKDGSRERHPDPVMEMRQQVSTLESYLEKRGAVLPSGYLKGRVVLPNPRCKTSQSISVHPEVIGFNKWNELRPDFRAGISNWIKDAFRGSKGDLQNETIQKLHFILGTAPMWDRLELRSGRHVLGEFIEFKGKSADMQKLRNLKRSKVNRFIIQKSTVFGFLGGSEHVVQYSLRDYRSEGSSASELKEITVHNKTELIFQPMNSKKSMKFKLSKISSLILSA